VKVLLEAGVVLEEKLDFYPKGRQKCLFCRTSNPNAGASATITFPGNNLGGVRGLNEQTAPDALFISVAAAFNQPLLMKIRTWFSEMKTVNTLSFRADFAEHVALFENDSPLKKRLNSWLYAADLGIKDFAGIDREYYQPSVIGKGFKREAKTGTNKELVFLHGGQSEEFIEYAQESSGTRRWINLFLGTYQAIEDSSLVFIDEISADLHPLLATYFIALFHNPRFNPKNAQLICTTHHSSLLSSDLLRRDQIWFAEKDGEGASYYYSLLDYSPRKDKAIMKGYLAGEYGAVPDLAAMDSLLEKMGL
jgi:hypothetical protein